MSHQIHTYTELEQQIHQDLRTQHPDWIQPSGKCPKCDDHEARLKKLLEALAQPESNPEAGHQVLLEDRKPEAHDEIF
jgi:hypothetical protein